MKVKRRKIIEITIVFSALIAGNIYAQSVVKPDFRVDNAPSAAEAGEPAVQALLNSSFVVAWLDLRNYPWSKVIAKIYDQNGTLIRNEFQLDDGGSLYCAFDIGAGGMTTDSNGNFFLTFTWSNDYTILYGRLRKFLPNGDPAGPSVSTRESGPTYSQVIQVARGKNDKIIISYAAANTIYYRIFDNNLSAITNSIQVNQTTSYGPTGLAANAGGDFVVVWEMMDGPMMARLYDSDGNPRGGEFGIEQGVSAGRDPRVAYNKQGNFCVVWWSELFESFMRVFDGNGNPLTDAYYLGPASAESNEEYGPPAVEADDAGNFIIAYEYSSDLTPKAVYGTILDPSGGVLSLFFPVSELGGGFGGGEWMTTDVASLYGGQFAVAWRDGRNDPNGDIYAAIIQNTRWWLPEEDPIPAAGPMALALLAGALGWALRRRLHQSTRY